jgi:ArsR family transcriptional regulator
VEHAKIEQVSRALADETRLIIFEEISVRPGMTCGEIVSLRGVTPATISHHLKVLQEAGLIECRKEGQFVRSHPVSETVEDYAAALQKIAGGAKRTGRRAKANGDS